MNVFLSPPIAEPLTRWYEKNARRLPWRQTGDPYRVWVSEIMLQQTRVETVIPYYVRFLEALPDVMALAKAPEETLLKLWEGLGYYSRARNMQKAAQKIAGEYGGVFPRDVPSLLSLPGIGPYTAGAVASIAYGVPAPAVDGNVLRVLARLSNSIMDIAAPAARKAAEEAVLAMMASAPPGIFNQALMELGACVCLPNAAPLCHACPLNALCAGHRAGSAASLPVRSKKAPRKVEALTVFALHAAGTYYVRKRPEAGLLASLWELPNVVGHLDERDALRLLAGWGATPLGEITRREKKHVFTHVEWHMRIYALDVAMKTPPPGWEALKNHALPTAFKKCLG